MTTSHDPVSERALHVGGTLARVMVPSTPSSMVNSDAITLKMAVNLKVALGLSDMGISTLLELLAHVGLNHDDIREAIHKTLRGLAKDAAGLLDERTDEANMPDHLREPLRRVRLALAYPLTRHYRTEPEGPGLMRVFLLSPEAREYWQEYGFDWIPPEEQANNVILLSEDDGRHLTRMLDKDMPQ